MRCGRISLKLKSGRKFIIRSDYISKNVSGSSVIEKANSQRLNGQLTKAWRCPFTLRFRATRKSMSSARLRNFLTGKNRLLPLPLNRNLSYQSKTQRKREIGQGKLLAGCRPQAYINPSHRSGRYRSGQTGRTVNPLAYAFAGSNPALPTAYTR